MSAIFTIPVSRLKEGHDTFYFEIGKEFFGMFEESEIKEGVLVATTDIEKSSTHMDLDIRISGKVRISCDRCLEMFDLPVECNNLLIVKYGAVKDDSDPDIFTIPRDENDLDLKQYFYEFIYLALPIQRIHPDDENGKSTCDPLMLEKLKEHLVEDETKSDPRWDELKKLMNNN